MNALLQRLSDVLDPAACIILRHHKKAHLPIHQQRQAEINKFKVIQEFKDHIIFCRYLHNDLIRPSFVKSLRLFEIIISIFDDYRHPDDMPDEIDDYVNTLKRSIPNFDYLGFKLSHLIIGKDDLGVYINF